MQLKYFVSVMCIRLSDKTSKMASRTSFDDNVFYLSHVIRKLFFCICENKAAYMDRAAARFVSDLVGNLSCMFSLIFKQYSPS